MTNPAGCTINKNHERLDCGAFAAGETKTINVEGSPKDAGNFDFELDVADQGLADLEQDGDAVSAEGKTYDASAPTEARQKHARESLKGDLAAGRLEPALSADALAKIADVFCVDLGQQSLDSRLAGKS